MCLIWNYEKLKLNMKWKDISMDFVLGWGCLSLYFASWSTCSFLCHILTSVYYFLLVLSWWQTRVSRVLSPAGRQGGVDDTMRWSRPYNECANKFCPLCCCRPRQAGWASRHQVAGAEEKDYSDAHRKSLGRQILLHQLVRTFSILLKLQHKLYI